jgi:recombination protein RecA
VATAKKQSAKSARGSVKKKKAKPKLDSGLAFQQAMSQKGFVQLLQFSDDDCLAHLKGCLRTGSIALDGLLGGQGIPLGRITEIYGNWHIGKTTVLNQLFAEAQRMGGWACVFDTETAMSDTYTIGLGVDPKKLSYAQFSSGQGSLENVCLTILNSVRWWKEHDPDRMVLLGLDSLGGTPTADELAAPLTPDSVGGEAQTGGDGKKKKKSRQPGVAARVMHAFRRQIPQELGNTKIGLVVINHEYQSWSSGKTRRETFGGEAMRAAASIRLKLFSVGHYLERNGVTIGKEVCADLVKDKIFGKTGGKARFALLNNIGIDNTWSLFEELKQRGVIVQGGAGWCAMNLDGEEFKFQGWNGFQKLCDMPVDEGKLGYFDRIVSVYEQLHRSG